MSQEGEGLAREQRRATGRLKSRIDFNTLLTTVSAAALTGIFGVLIQTRDAVLINGERLAITTQQVSKAVDQIVLLQEKTNQLERDIPPRK
jgi:hypothetical protein